MVVGKFSPVAAFFHGGGGGGGGGGRENQSVAAELEGSLLISRSVFPYLMLVAFEAGGPLRALSLLLLSPLLSLLAALRLEAAALRLAIFVSTAGLRVADVKAVAKATLPRFYLRDVSETAYGVFSRCGGEKYVVTSIPRIMAEPFLRDYLGVGCVVATEMKTTGAAALGGVDRFLGLVAPPGVMVGRRWLDRLKAALGGSGEIDVGLGDGRLSDHPFMLLCRLCFRPSPAVQEAYVVPPEEQGSPLPRKDYPKPLIFHDGRFVMRPTPLDMLVVLLWLPMGISLAVARIVVGIFLPFKLQPLVGAAIGVRVRARFAPTAVDAGRTRKTGTLYACSHRTLLDPVIAAATLQRSVVAVTYSLSSFSELLSPIPTVRLTRDRARDEAAMRKLLERGDLVVCPEGTTCREPYLLRFSPLFAEIAEEIVPLAVAAEGSMFYGTTVRGYKWLDSFFFLMNPVPSYQLEFLDKISGNRSSGYDVANRVQRALGTALGFECTNFTRRDKYRMIADNDGVVEHKI